MTGTMGIPSGQCAKSDTEPLQKMRMNQGNHECEVLGTEQDEETETNIAWENCLKNPGHLRFIPAPDFSLSDLPVWCRKSIVLDHVKYLSAMTVRLRVGYNSLARPDGYPFCDFRGTKLTRSGSGLVWNITQESGPCRCPDCNQSSSPCQTCYRIDVKTARHVVYDNEEAQATQVNLFYDDDASKTDGRMKTVWGTKVIEINDEGDHCTLRCFTHDKLLVRQLTCVKDRYRDIAFNFEGEITAWPNTDWKYLCLIVSHPHGQPKKITVGEMSSCTKIGPLEEREFSYSTDTCPGSSGAFMTILEFYEAKQKVFLFTGMKWGTVHRMRNMLRKCNVSGWSNPYTEDGFTKVSVHFPRYLTHSMGLNLLPQGLGIVIVTIYVCLFQALLMFWLPPVTEILLSAFDSMDNGKCFLKLMSMFLLIVALHGKYVSYLVGYFEEYGKGHRNPSTEGTFRSILYFQFFMMLLMWHLTILFVAPVFINSIFQLTFSVFQGLFLVGVYALLSYGTYTQRKSRLEYVVGRFLKLFH